MVKICPSLPQKVLTSGDRSKPGVLHVVYIQAFLLEVGITAVDKIGGNQAPWLEVKVSARFPASH